MPRKAFPVAVCVVPLLAIIISAAHAQTPHISSISPTSLAPGMQATLTGSGFGATQGSHGSVQFQSSGSAAVVSWNDTQIVATVPAGILAMCTLSRTELTAI